MSTPPRPSTPLHPFVIRIPLGYSTAEPGDDELTHHAASCAVIHVRSTSEMQSRTALYNAVSLLHGRIVGATVLNIASVRDVMKHAPMQVNAPYLPIHLSPAPPDNSRKYSWEQLSFQLNAMHVSHTDEMPWLKETEGALERYKKFAFVNMLTQPMNLSMWLHRLAAHALSAQELTQLVAVDWVQDAHLKHRHCVSLDQPTVAL